MLGRHPPETREGERGGEVHRAEISPFISSATQRENGIGPGIHESAHAAREMDSEKRELRIGYGIDKRPYQLRALRNQVIVFAAKRNNHALRIVSGHARDTV